VRNFIDNRRKALSRESCAPVELFLAYGGRKIFNPAQNLNNKFYRSKISALLIEERDKRKIIRGECHQD